TQPPKLAAPWAASLASTHCPAPGRAVVALVSADGITPTGGDLATMTFTVPAGAEGLAKLSLGEIEILGKDGVCRALTLACPLELPLGPQALPGPARAGAPALQSGEERLADTILLQLGNYAAVVDGALVQIDPDNRAVVPRSADGRTLVPLRFLAQTLHATVAWNGATGEITMQRGGDSIVMTLGKTEYSINGTIHTMETPPVAEEGRTLLPLRAIAQAFGAAVEWQAEEQLIIIAPKDLPWQLGGSGEAEATRQAMALMAPRLRDFL
ncbi:MAG: copper amine oxidase N-terminal domain-containing protein, partial [Pseudoflavonifractor sp.]